MRGKHRRPRSRGPSLESVLLEAARRSPPTGEHVDDDDCPLCRMAAGQEPIEVITLPDGSIVEVREWPPPGRRPPPD